GDKAILGSPSSGWNRGQRRLCARGPRADQLVRDLRARRVLPEGQPGLPPHPAVFVEDGGIAALGKEQAVRTRMARGRRARQRFRHRTRGSLELVIEAADKRPADEVIGGEGDRSQPGEEKGDRDDENTRAERHGLPPQAQAVTDAAYGVNQRRLLEVDLLAQVADVVLNNAGVAAEAVAPAQV